MYEEPKRFNYFKLMLKRVILARMEYMFLSVIKLKKKSRALSKQGKTCIFIAPRKSRFLALNAALMNLK